jgi:hypothetical protein
MQRFSDFLATNWKKAAIVVALLSLGATTAGTVATVRKIPEEMRVHNDLLVRHDSSTTAYVIWLHDTFGDISDQQAGPLNQISREIKEVRHIEQQQLCLQVAQLRRDDWTKCLVSAP